MFRVPQRGSPAPVVAPPDRTTWHGTLTARAEPAPQRAVRGPSDTTLSERLRIAPWESMPAPWGEPENPVPYVIITTQPWPEEWWRPGPTRSPSNGSAPHALSAQEVPPGFGAIPVVRGGAMATARGVPTAADIRNRHVAERQRRVRARARRRGTLTRLAIFAIGLVISLIAVETATRRRS